MSGYTSLQAFWVGGAANPPADGGYRSLLAFWAGGAAGIEAPPIPPVLEEERRGAPQWVKEFLRQHYEEEQKIDMMARIMLLLD